MVGLDYYLSRLICTYVPSALTAPLACCTNSINNLSYSQLTKIGEKNCFQAMHVPPIMQYLRVSDINGGNGYLVLHGSYLFQVKIFPTPANCLWLAGNNVYVPAGAIRIVLKIVQRKEEPSTELAVQENRSPCGSPTLTNKKLSKCHADKKLSDITIHIGRMDNKVPKGRGFGRSTISQVRPEFIVVRNEGMELDQPQNARNLERCVPYSGPEPLARSRECRFNVAIEELLIPESNWRHLLEKAAMIPKGAQSRNVENITEKPRGALDQPKVSRMEDQAGGRMADEGSAVGLGLEDRRYDSECHDEVKRQMALTRKDSIWKDPWGDLVHLKRRPRRNVEVDENSNEPEHQEEYGGPYRGLSEKNRLARNVVESRSHSTFYPSRVCLSDDRLSAIAQRRRKNIKLGQYDTRVVACAASRSNGRSPEKSDLRHRHYTMRNIEAINSEDTAGQCLESLAGSGATRQINHSPLTIVTIVDKVKRSDAPRPALKLSYSGLTHPRLSSPIRGGAKELGECIGSRLLEALGSRASAKAWPPPHGWTGLTTSAVRLSSIVPSEQGNSLLQESEADSSLRTSIGKAFFQTDSQKTTDQIRLTKKGSGRARLAVQSRPVKAQDIDELRRRSVRRWRVIVSRLWRPQLRRLQRCNRLVEQGQARERVRVSQHEADLTGTRRPSKATTKSSSEDPFEVFRRCRYTKPSL